MAARTGFRFAFGDGLSNAGGLGTGGHKGRPYKETRGMA